MDGFPNGFFVLGVLVFWLLEGITTARPTLVLGSLTRCVRIKARFSGVTSVQTGNLFRNDEDMVDLVRSRTSFPLSFLPSFLVTFDFAANRSLAWRAYYCPITGLCNLSTFILAERADSSNEIVEVTVLSWLLAKACSCLSQRFNWLARRHREKFDQNTQKFTCFFLPRLKRKFHVLILLPKN